MVVINLFVLAALIARGILLDGVMRLDPVQTTWG